MTGTRKTQISQVRPLHGMKTCEIYLILDLLVLGVLSVSDSVLAGGMATPAAPENLQAADR